MLNDVMWEVPFGISHLVDKAEEKFCLEAPTVSFQLVEENTETVLDNYCFEYIF